MTAYTNAPRGDSKGPSEVSKHSTELDCVDAFESADGRDKSIYLGGLSTVF